MRGRADEARTHAQNVREVIEALHRAGASEILVAPIEKLVK